VAPSQTQKACRSGGHTQRTIIAHLIRNFTVGLGQEITRLVFHQKIAAG